MQGEDTKSVNVSDAVRIWPLAVYHDKKTSSLEDSVYCRETQLAAHE